MSTCILLAVAFRVVLATKVSIAFSSIGNCLVMQELIEWLVSSMCGNLQHQTSLNLDYVIAKNVLATKYKWAWSVLRKPIVSHEWLKHCAAQHRLVPYDPFRLPAFAGLKICATGIAFGAGREEIQMGARENGATYSADLTMDCTHLIAQISSHLS
jgi:topoisomerase (DNA) II binding protein 1